VSERGYTVELRTVPQPTLLESDVAKIAAYFGGRKRPSVVVSADLLTRVITLRYTIDASNPHDALMSSFPYMLTTLDRCRAVARAEIAEAAVFPELPEDQFASARDDLVGTQELANRLGISRERVRQYQEMGRFPRPLVTVRGTHVWRWGDIVDWLAVGGRRASGHPRKVEKSAEPKKVRRRVAV